MRPSSEAAAGGAARRAGTSVEVALAGDFDMVATFRVEPEIDRLLAEDGIRRLVVDLADVRFIDSAGVGALLSMRERATRLGVRMTLANVPHPVQRVLDATGTGAVLTG
jgi:anti-sigma B factor antagonist